MKLTSASLLAIVITTFVAPAMGRPWRLPKEDLVNRSWHPERAGLSRRGIFHSRPQYPPVTIVNCVKCGAFQLQIEHYISNQYLQDDLARERTHVEIELQDKPEGSRFKKFLGFSARPVIRIKARYYRKDSGDPMASSYTKYYTFASFQEIGKLKLPKHTAQHEDPDYLEVIPPGPDDWHVVGSTSLPHGTA